VLFYIIYTCVETCDLKILPFSSLSKINLDIFGGGILTVNWNGITFSSEDIGSGSN